MWLFTMLPVCYLLDITAYRNDVLLTLWMIGCQLNQSYAAQTWDFDILMNLSCSTGTLLRMFVGIWFFSPPHY